MVNSSRMSLKDKEEEGGSEKEEEKKGRGRSGRGDRRRIEGEQKKGMSY